MHIKAKVNRFIMNIRNKINWASWNWNPWQNYFHWIACWTQVDARVVWVIGWWRIDCKLEGVVSEILSESELPCCRIIFNVNNVIDSELECLKCRVEFFCWMRPTVAIRWYQVTSVADVRIVEVIIGLLNWVSQAYSQAYPSNELFDLDSPTLLSLSN